MLLARKTVTEMPIAPNDVVFAQLAADPTMPQFSSVNNLTVAGDNAAQNGEVVIENTNRDWINNRWRPAMGWTYMATCITDFIIFPILWSILQAYAKGSVTAPWSPLTLQGAGLFHVAMGTILGVAVWGRTKEKIEGKINS